MTIKIDKGIPTPVSNRYNKKYPFEELEVGDSFFIPAKTIWQMNVATHNKNGKQFIKRPWTEEDVDGVRVWRIK